MKDILVKTNRGEARWIGKAEDDYRVYDSIEYEDVKVNGEWYTVHEYNTFTAYTEDGELICGSPDIVSTFEELKSRHNISIKQISDRFEIPYRTVQNWSSGQRQCPEYIIKMMDELLSKEREA